MSIKGRAYALADYGSGAKLVDIAELKTVASWPGTNAFHGYVYNRGFAAFDSSACIVYDFNDDGTASPTRYSFDTSFSSMLRTVGSEWKIESGCFVAD